MSSLWDFKNREIFCLFKVLIPSNFYSFSGNLWSSFLCILFTFPFFLSCPTSFWKIPQLHIPLISSLFSSLYFEVSYPLPLVFPSAFSFLNAQTCFFEVFSSHFILFNHYFKIFNNIINLCFQSICSDVFAFLDFCHPLCCFPLGRCSSNSLPWGLRANSGLAGFWDGQCRRLRPALTCPSP